MFHSRFSRFLSVLCVLALLALVLPLSGVALAQGPEPPTLPPDLGSLVVQFIALAGIGALIAFIVNALKTFGVVKDGTAANWATMLNLLGLVALFVLHVFVPSADIGKLDGAAATIAQIGVLVLGLITQMLGSKLAHATVSGVWLIGKSFSQRKL